jgi:TRAP-type C4-dicarboxylate transport system substrate-binding protein
MRRFAAVILLAFAGGAQAQTVELKVSHFVPPTHGFHVDVLDPWLKDLEKRTGGKLQGRLFAGNSPFGKTENQADQVKQGVVDVAWGLNGIPRGRFLRTSIMEMPFVAESADSASRTLWAMLRGPLADDYKGFKVLAVHCHNPGLFHTRDKPISSIEDVKGMRIRAPNYPTQKLLEHLGAAPVGMPPTQVYENLEKGVIDGAVFPWDAIKGFRLEALLKHHLDARVYTSCFHILMNEQRYASLPAPLKKAIDDTTGAAMVNRFGAWWNGWDKAGLDAVKPRGNVVVAVPDAQRDRWRALLHPVTAGLLAELEKGGVANPKAILDEMREKVAAFAKK